MFVNYVIFLADILFEIIKICLLIAFWIITVFLFPLLMNILSVITASCVKQKPVTFSDSILIGKGIVNMNRSRARIG